MIKLETYIKRFMNLIEFEPNTGCWLFSGPNDKQGYGYAQISDNGKSIEKAHRVSFFLFKKINPNRLFVLHKCDTPSCVNPDHLRLGTAKDNAEDAVNKGRHRNQIKTHCTNGHEFSPKNTKLIDGKRRRCKTCMDISNKRRYVK